MNIVTTQDCSDFSDGEEQISNENPTQSEPTKTCKPLSKRAKYVWDTERE